MKVGSRCGYCLIHRGYMEILRSTEDEGLRREAVRQLISLLSERFNGGAVPSVIGSERDRLIRRVTGCADPYAEMKRRANDEALSLLPRFRALVEVQPSGEHLRMACKIACIGNVIEYDVPDHSHDIDDALALAEAEGLFIDDTDRFKELIGIGVDVMVLTDNAGEIVFDRLVVHELRSLGAVVTVAVKGGPALNDATMEDARWVGMVGEADHVITTGTDAIGVDLDGSSEEFRDAFYSAEAIVAKGMANWETLTEYPAPCPTLFLLRTKCEPVASTVGAPLEKNVAKLVPRGWRL